MFNNRTITLTGNPPQNKGIFSWVQVLVTTRFNFPKGNTIYEFKTLLWYQILCNFYSYNVSKLPELSAYQVLLRTLLPNITLTLDGFTALQFNAAVFYDMNFMILSWMASQTDLPGMSSGDHRVRGPRS